MKKNKLFVSLLFIGIISIFLQFTLNNKNDERFVTYLVNPKKENIQFYFKDEANSNFGSLNNLKIYLSKNNKELLFAMNGGMYKKDKTPQGLFIQKSKIITSTDTTSGNGNFYLKPNGIFYLNKNKEAFISTTKNFVLDNNIEFATQSGPMLLVNGVIHKSFNENSKNLNIRNGVGILPNNTILFAMSKKEINFYDFAKFFKDKGCKNALYLDGFVSRTYCPEQKWMQNDGDFGVIIGVTKE
jgi:uncharacterized protein YigE (DUF2233 family)